MSIINLITSELAESLLKSLILLFALAVVTALEPRIAQTVFDAGILLKGRYYAERTLTSEELKIFLL
ncbi:hypothetical protein IJH29_01220 [Candidatus Saccharibacteria bacterium]|nr:hypothetical protein [Candidatus Saccharibacteria bacterium]